MRSRKSGSRPCFLWMIGLFLPIFPSSAEIYAPGGIPLQPIPVEVQVERGKKVDIPLRVYGGGHESVTYRFRSTPRFGTLIDSRMISENDGVVTYQHSGEFGHDRDIFHFAAKSIEGVSAQVGAEITVTDRHPKLVAPTHAEFGEVLIGTGAAVHVSIANQGGGTDRGVATATAPWQIAGNTTYSLGPGESVVFTIVCNPIVEGEHHGNLRFSSSPGSSMTLRATAVPPFRINPPKLNLTLDRESRIRAGTLRIENTAGLDQTIKIRGDDSLSLPEEVSLLADDDAAIHLQTKPENLAAIDTSISLTGTNYSTQIPVTAATVPAIVEVNETVLDFDEVPLQQTAETYLVISNHGGEKAFLDLAVTPPFSLPSNSFDFSLEPGEVRKVGVSIRPESWGETSGEIRVRGFQTERYVRLFARTPRPAAAGTPSRGKSASITKKWNVLDEGFPLLGEARLENVTNTTATIAWPTPDTNARFRLETRILNVGKGTKKMEIRWIPLSNVIFDHSGGETHATATELTPGAGYNVRIVEVDALGQILRASRTFQVVPPPEKRFALTPIKVLMAAQVVVIALLVRQKVQKRRQACRQLVGVS